jgi:exodeoxyribonuclease VII large subunit
MQSEADFQSPRVISVAELNQSVARLLERSIPLCWIAGEVSNFTKATSGHWYFTLKDAQAQVRAVMFKSRAMAVDFLPREGDRIEVRATVSLYAPRGDFQINVEGIRRAGQGNLYEAFLRLKQKLGDAGLFDAARKRALPGFPRRIGIITSPQAAALQDILTTLRRRAPHVQLVIYPTPVQGNGAAEKIAQALALANRRNECDVLILARGGGSIEDLWSFNDEQLAHAIAASALPIISGVGHETDFTIADFVADLRAPTPTAAAEIATPQRAELLQDLNSLRLQWQRAMRRRLERDTQTLDHVSRRLISPLAYLRSERSRLQHLIAQLGHLLRNRRQSAQHLVAQLQQKLQAQQPDGTAQRQQLQQQCRNFQNHHRQMMLQRRHQLGGLQAQLELLNPQRTLERGYAIIQNRDGQVVHRKNQLVAGHAVTVRVADGAVELGIARVADKGN